jgi:N-acylneuraminate cytidylyltransferase
MSNLAVIPARGGSKRIPGKNIKYFLGKPIIAYSIEACIDSGLFSEIMVSTNDQEIATIAKNYGANIPFYRSEKNSDDFATTMEVLQEVLSQYSKDGKNFDKICCIYPTAPFVTAKKLEKAFKVLVERKFESVIPVMKFSFPIQRSLIVKDGRINYKFPEYCNARSQDLEIVYHDVGQFYWMKSSVIEQNNIITQNTGYIEVEELEGQDIDTFTDWKLAELKYELLQSIK